MKCLLSITLVCVLLTGVVIGVIANGVRPLEYYGK